MSLYRIVFAGEMSGPAKPGEKRPLRPRWGGWPNIFAIGGAQRLGVSEFSDFVSAGGPLQYLLAVVTTGGIVAFHRETRACGRSGTVRSA